jgi:3-hydroxyacyl-[acyl-carrier-protein] dehydratase
MNFLKLDKKKILEYQKNRDPYLMIDCATKVIPGKFAKGYKKLTKKDWFFDVHWPGDPNMPGMLQIESLIQMSALAVQTLPGNKGKTLYLVGANNLKFFRKVLPGDKLEIESKLLKESRGIYNFESSGFVNGKKTCKADFSLIISGSIKFKIKKY